ncbi:unnamed protein product [Microthlaspi erraticum]|uniref:Reverse transcriptase zinc-binding domain-containing protein n=1 Tax=Microthlaspi erraticum TaxID=1685480 RepID=A0A6D2JUE9_9BRAS|nr:unnamed protein product [Microthlaspi erraticum]
MHWLAWRKLCRHKTDGGLGFRVIEDFNTALLAKQLWRLMDNPDSLFAKVFKGRYFRNSTPLDPIRSYSPSYGWQSIVSARPLELSDEGTLPVFGPDIRRLQAQSWKVKCTTKLQHFLWQIITGCLSVGARLCSRGMRVDPLCVRCGMGDETINHMLFECPPARQAWALSPIPTPPQFFPTGALYSNMAHLFWNLPDNDDMLMSNGICDNGSPGMGSSPNGSRRSIHNISINSGHVPLGEWCQIDGAWKVTDSRAGLGWYNFDPDSGSVDGSSNLRRGLSPLQTELEALVWAMQSVLPHIHSQNEEHKADKLARSARAQPHDVYYINSVPPVPLPQLSSSPRQTRSRHRFPSPYLIHSLSTADSTPPPADGIFLPFSRFFPPITDFSFRSRLLRLFSPSPPQGPSRHGSPNFGSLKELPQYPCLLDFFFYRLHRNQCTTVPFTRTIDRGIRSSPFLSLILQVHRSEVVNGYRTQGPDCTLQVMSLRTS